MMTDLCVVRRHTTLQVIVQVIFSITTPISESRQHFSTSPHVCCNGNGMQLIHQSAQKKVALAGACTSTEQENVIVLLMIVVVAVVLYYCQ